MAAGEKDWRKGLSLPRFVMACMVLGGACTMLVLGVSLHVRSRGASQQPVAVDLASIEAGKLPTDRHVRLGEHMALYQASTLYLSAIDDPEAPGTRVKIAWYPIYSDDHPFAHRISSLQARFGGLERVPRSALPTLENFAVLVRTRRFETVGSIPDGGQWRDELTGLTAGRFGGLSHEHATLLRKAFPGLDPEKVLVLEEGVTPPRGEAAPGLAILGVILGVVGFVLMQGAWASESVATAGGGTPAPAPTPAGAPASGSSSSIRLPRIEVTPVELPSAGSLLSMIGRLVLAAVLALVAVASFMMSAQDYRLYLTCTAEPGRVSLASIEMGAGIPNPHVRLDRHLVLYQATVPIPRRGDASSPQTPLARAWVPLLSESHPAMARLRELGAAYGGPEGVPRAELPSLAGLGVLVETRRFATVGDIPTRGEWRDEVVGVAVGTVASRSADRQAVAAALPGVDLHKAQDLREGRKPPAFWEWIAGALLGLLLLCGAVKAIFPR